MRRPVYPFAGSYGHLSLPSSKPEEKLNRSASFQREPTVNHSIIVQTVAKWHHEDPYYISTKRPEGVRSTGVQVGLIVSLQEADVIVTLCLRRGQKETVVYSSTVRGRKEQTRGNARQLRGEFMNVRFYYTIT